MASLTTTAVRSVFWQWSADSSQLQYCISPRLLSCIQQVEGPGCLCGKSKSWAAGASWSRCKRLEAYGHRRTSAVYVPTHSACRESTPLLLSRHLLLPRHYQHIHASLCNSKPRPKGSCTSPRQWLTDVSPFTPSDWAPVSSYGRGANQELRLCGIC